MSEVLLYSFRRCPYAMRARLALRYSGVPVRIVEVSLKAKPAEMLALSPKGTVPVLSVDGEVIDESLAIMQWALAQHDPDNWLLGGDPAVLALVAENDQGFKYHLDRYKYAERYPEQPMEHYRAEGEVFLQKLEGLLTGRAYLLADHPSLADMALAPFVRQFAHVDRDWFAAAPYPRLQQWLERFLQSPLFVGVMAKT
ncbi:glutathione S-transferase [Pseudomonas fluorescens group sp.]|uniref:Glutathione-S-transferase domain protein n=2 Tax=Pseudomonas fluorescens TaxID=294 RepID=C3KDI3_PSEFS|nr:MULTISPECIES: glutathione S-transferase [Pseudomonas fluorescens group]MBZ6456209.1 glutathione S-transferase [Pseudomonas fluorescens group sp.]MBZ6460520.1 glutathione S-transferase [Pseudomonas fluorescens group sp.]MBZ6466162.1 glutathione S-transferase [Pseudomonas fluorescens group sp.]WQD69873.1 glutathione S-transferase [Pseudomonas marginalis]CAI2797722.1 Putative glutathione-S-transferase domain protein [Pseudomonas fluorescens SBW25]